jgi:adenosylcobyric acid synthase
MGETTPHADAIFSSGRVSGTYIHGLFDDDELRHSFVDFERATCGIAPALSHVCVTAQRQARIDRWAGHLRQSLDMDLIRGWALQG